VPVLTTVSPFLSKSGCAINKLYPTAVKSNPDINIVRALAQLGCGFDCASKSEIEEVLSIGVSPDRIIFANPCKGPGTWTLLNFY